MSALSPFVSFRVSPALARISPFAVFIALIAIESLVGDRLGDPRWFTLARPLIVGALLIVLWRHYEELHGSFDISRRHVILGIATGVAVFATWIAFDQGWATLSSSQKPGFVPENENGSINWTIVVLRLIGFALVVPVMEELFWRSFLLRWIESRDFVVVDPRKVGFVSFAVTSALFASEHSLWFAGLVAGIAYNFCYMRSRNLRVSILSHAITNGTLALWILATGNWRLW